MTDVYTLAPIEYDPFSGSTLARVVPTTEPQREVWLADRLGREASLAYNESVSLSFSGTLNADALCRALGDLVQRHEALRATISGNGEELCIAGHLVLVVPVTDHSASGGAEREEAIAAAQRRAVETPFDLQNGPLFKAEILRLGAANHLLILTAHHVVCDGWSLGVLIHDLADLYARRVGAPGHELLPPESFADYALARSAAAGNPEQAAHEAFWVSTFSGRTPVLDLPTDRPRAAWRSFTSRREDHVLDAGLVSEVRKAGSRDGGGLFATMLGSFAMLLQRLAGSSEVVVGIPAAGQSVEGVEGLVGHCVNLLPLRLDINPATPLRTVVAATQTLMLDAYEHQSYTYGTQLKKLAIERDPSRLPLVSVLFNIDQALNANAAGFRGLGVDFSSNPRSFENFELSVSAVQVNDALRLECQYNADLFDRATIRRWLACYETLLRAYCNSADTPAGHVPLVGADDQRLLAQWNSTTRAFSRTLLVHELIEAQVSRTPDRRAVTWRGTTITYAALDAQANRIAHALRARGLRPGEMVGVCLNRGPGMIAAMLAILKAGAAYVPLAPSYPADRLAFMAEDAGLSALVAETGAASRLAYPRERSLFLDADSEEVAAQPDSRMPADGDPNRPETCAYVIYTSGSTGKPKGVEVPHRTVVNLLEAMASEPGLSEDDRLVAVSALSFDMAVAELLLPLVVGAEIVLATQDEVADGALLSALIKESRATIMHATPATWRLMITAGWAGNPGFRAVCGGEPLGADLARQLVDRTDALWNGYGPTETTVYSTCWRVTNIESGIRIGGPIANTVVRILDDQRLQCPIGVPGEICIGGEGVTRGYLHRPELTAERFIADPFSPSPGAKLYRTGDRGRWRDDGLLEHLGRLDFQVKVRGYRIELGEIEVCLASHPDVAQAVVSAREDRPGDVRLVAYLAVPSGAAPADAALTAHLKATLPDYMIPQHFVALPALPLQPNGKVDRKSLPAPDPLARPTAEYVAPRTDMERAVATEMEASLGMPGIGIHDNFFRLGGHSLLAMQLTSRLNRRFGTNLSIRALFDGPTAERLAAVVEIEAASKTRHHPIERRAAQSRAPASYMQERQWLLSQAYAGRVVYNTPSAHRLRGVMNPDAFERAFREMVRRQSSLRTSFEHDDSGLVQRIHDDVAFPPLFPAEDLSVLRLAEREPTLRRRVDALCVQTFDLGQAPLFKARMFRMAEQEHLLFFMTHHIVWDGWSFDLFSNEMAELYGAFCEQRGSPLADLSISYGDFASWHREWLRSPDHERQATFWLDRLAKADQVLKLPTDKPRRPGMAGNGETVGLRIDKARVDALHELAQRTGTTVYVSMLTAFYVLLYDYSRQTNLIVGTPVRCRNTVELESIMGDFNNLLPLQIQVKPGERFTDLVDAVRAVVVEVLSHTDLPTEELARGLSAAGRDSVLYQALFSFQDARQRKTPWGGLRYERYPAFRRGSTEDFSMWFLETTDGMDGGMTFNSDILERSTVQWLGQRYFEILDAACAAPETTVASLAGPPTRAVPSHLAGTESAPLSRANDPTSRAEAYLAPRNDLEERLAKVWQQVLGVKRVGVTDNLADLGGTSLLAVRLAYEIQTKINKSIPLAVLLECRTIAQLSGVLSEDRVPPSSTLIPVQPMGSKPPLFLADAVFAYTRLIPYLDMDRPVYGLAGYLEEGRFRFTRIEEIATRYLEEVRKVQPEGPYYIAGHSLGGVVAFEMAQQLRQAGQDVALLTLIDPPPPGTFELGSAIDTLDSKVQQHAANLVGKTSGETTQYFLSWFRAQLHARAVRPYKQLVCAIYHLCKRSLPAGLKQFYIYEVIYRKVYPDAIRNYQPTAYPGRAVFLFPEAQFRESESAFWQEICPAGLEMCGTPGDHLTMLLEPNVRHLVDTMKRCLAAASDRDVPMRPESAP